MSASVKMSRRIRKPKIDDFFPQASALPKPMKIESSIDFGNFIELSGVPKTNGANTSELESNAESEESYVYDDDKDPNYSLSESDMSAREADDNSSDLSGTDKFGSVTDASEFDVLINFFLILYSTHIYELSSALSLYSFRFYVQHHPSRQISKLL